MQKGRAGARTGITMQIFGPWAQTSAQYTSPGPCPAHPGPFRYDKALPAAFGRFLILGGVARARLSCPTELQSSQYPRRRLEVAFELQLKSRSPGSCHSSWSLRPTLAPVGLLFLDRKRLPRACASHITGATQGPERHTNIKGSFLETGLDVLPAAPGRRASFHD